MSTSAVALCPSCFVLGCICKGKEYFRLKAESIAPKPANQPEGQSMLHNTVASFHAARVDAAARCRSLASAGA
eukprot:scaffold45769_cov17-Prasinocladus_malaysianus.AAC.1